MTAPSREPEPGHVDPLFGDYPAALAPFGLNAPAHQPAPTLDPRLAGFRLPAEWEEHERTLVSWPTREALWSGLFAEAKADYAGVIRAVAAFEPVTVLALPGRRGQVLDACGTANVQVHELGLDDSWIRDNGPLVVVDDRGGRLGIDFRFNSWGEKCLPYGLDAAASAGVLEHLGIERTAVDMVLEGGSVTVDGAGTLVTTEQCLLHSNRNPGLSKADVDAVLRGALGIRTILWLPYGHLDDRHTDGHVDGVCTLVAPGHAIVQTCGDPRDVNHEAMARNLRYLRDTPDAGGRTLELTGLDLFPRFELQGVTDFVSYANFYVCNGGVVVPVAGRPDMDAEALARIAGAFPGREVVGVAGTTLAFGGGGPHCITMQIPRGRAVAGQGATDDD